MDDDLVARRRADYLLHTELLSALPGGASVIAKYEDGTSFHDATLEDLKLSMRGKSLIRIANPYPTIFDGGRLIVTFEIGRVVDANLDLFGENILFSLLLRRPPARPDRRNWLTRTVAEGDIEFDFEPTCGLGGFLIGRDVSVRCSRDRRADA